ncbi:hypothetical protein ATCV1_z650R [Acanthocystis turfacea chlorella virus 1]|uniref:Uncharacterized protein z650R n=1 Tax=Chlorovirus heliozoae TaxID=322019 RepID=A7K9R0_9PHYC|nr:hypothetical protein ATCV1_z650R [Acanthocystis turfacea chlorella virus 1]ABT16784.1 hypothetical protein ATCV1_z650R [Acanthocystis turfacea chlorella virus 1]
MVTLLASTTLVTLPIFTSFAGSWAGLDPAAGLVATAVTKAWLGAGFVITNTAWSFLNPWFAFPTLFSWFAPPAK